MEKRIITKDDIDISNVIELVKYIIFAVGGEHGLSETGIQKVAYYLKTQVNDRNDFKNNLPYYWYYYGPYSEVIKEAIELTSEEGAITKRPIDENNSVWYLKEPDNYTIPDNKNFHHINSIIEEEKIGAFDIRKLTFLIYRKYAPRIFRFRFFVTKQNMINLHDFLSRVIQSSPDGAVERYQRSLSKHIYLSEGVLPKNKLFKQYNDSFSYYVSILERFLLNSNNSNIWIDHLSDALNITEKVWKSFGEGERILSHDKYEPYEEKIDRWRNRYFSHLETLTSDLKTFDSHILSITDIDKLNCDFTEKEKRLLCAVLP